MKKQLILFTLAFSFSTPIKPMWLFEDSTTRELRETKEEVEELKKQVMQLNNKADTERQNREQAAQREHAAAQEFMERMKEWKKLGDLPPLQCSDVALSHIYLNPNNHRKLSPEDELRAEKSLVDHYMHGGSFHSDNEKGLVQFIFLNHYQREDVTLTPKARIVAENILLTMFRNKDNRLTSAEIKIAEGIEERRKGKELETSGVKTQ